MLLTFLRHLTSTGKTNSVVVPSVLPIARISDILDPCVRFVSLSFRIRKNPPSGNPPKIDSPLSAYASTKKWSRWRRPPLESGRLLPLWLPELACGAPRRRGEWCSPLGRTPFGPSGGFPLSYFENASATPSPVLLRRTPSVAAATAGSGRNLHASDAAHCQVFCKTNCLDSVGRTVYCLVIPGSRIADSVKGSGILCRSASRPV